MPVHRTGCPVVSAPVTPPAEPLRSRRRRRRRPLAPAASRPSHVARAAHDRSARSWRRSLCFAVAAALVGGYLSPASATSPTSRTRPSGPSAQSRTPPTQPIATLAGGDEATTLGPTTTDGRATTATAAARRPATAEATSRRSDSDAAERRRPRRCRRPPTRRHPVDRPRRQRRRPRSPPADPEAQNFLITGADNGACIDPDSPVRRRLRRPRDHGRAQRHDHGRCASTRRAKRVAILSFPRDLYVEIADTGNMSRINSAYERDEPQRLADTIYAQLRHPDRPLHPGRLLRLQDARRRRRRRVGAVRVPGHATSNTGLNVPEAGCFTFDGEPALAYVRSRHYEYEDPPGQRQLAERRHQRPRAHLAPAGLPAPRAVEHARQGPAQPDRRPRPDPRRHRVRRDRPRPHARQDDGVRRRDERRRPRLDRHLPDRGDRTEHQRGVGADPHHRRRQHAGRAGAVPRPDVAGRHARAGARRHDDGGAARGHHHDRRRHRSQRRVGAEHSTAGTGSARARRHRPSRRRCPRRRIGRRLGDRHLAAGGHAAAGPFGITPPRDVTC